MKGKKFSFDHKDNTLVIPVETFYSFNVFYFSPAALKRSFIHHFTFISTDDFESVFLLLFFQSPSKKLFS